MMSSEEELGQQLGGRPGPRPERADKGSPDGMIHHCLWASFRKLKTISVDLDRVERWWELLFHVPSVPCDFFSPLQSEGVTGIQRASSSFSATLRCWGPHGGYDRHSPSFPRADRRLHRN